MPDDETKDFYLDLANRLMTKVFDYFNNMISHTGSSLLLRIFD